MSRNVSSLSGRQGLQNSLFGRIVQAGPPEAGTHAKLAEEYLLGQAVTIGAASFYDLLSRDNAGKKALVCNGSACLCAGTQDAVRTKLEAHLPPGTIGHITCLGRCHENSAFHYLGANYSGNDINDLETITRGRKDPAQDVYGVASTCNPPMLTAPMPNMDALDRLLYEAMNQSPETLLDSVKASKLRGRGGAGFPTGLKWEAAKQAPGTKKYILCNADEGDPGAYIDRYIMEAHPHRVLFGMLVAAYIVGADEGAVYVRAEYPKSLAAMKNAVAEMDAAGMLGTRVCGSDFSFHIKILAGAGAYICGEETALIASLEGRRPEVSSRPPYPTTEGLFGKPTVVNNVETFANIHPILSRGSEAFAALGTVDSTGSKLVCLNGEFNRPGLFEVPMGTPLATIVDELGEGFRRPAKALHIGGPLGGLVPIARIPDLTLDFESFKKGGFLLGHGSILAIPEAVSILEYMEHLFEFCAVESCGKCFPCRLGATRGQEMLSAAVHEGAKLNRELLDDLLDTMEQGSLCAHGGGIPLPIRNALQYFGDELKAHFA